MFSTLHRIPFRQPARCAAWLRRARAWLFRGIAAITVLFLSGAEGGLQREIECLALNIYFESRLEPEEGRRAVAHVVLNRVRDRRWPDTPCRVIADGFPDSGALCQFSWYCDDRSNRPQRGDQWRDAKRLAQRVYWGRWSDPTRGALWYHADYVAPEWRLALQRGPQIGHHIFYYDAAAPDARVPQPASSAGP